MYALGCVLFEMLTGRAPFRRDHDAATLYAQIHEPPPSIRSMVPAIPPAFEDVIARALAKDPDGRYPSAGDLARATLAAGSGQMPTEPERTVAIGSAAPAPPVQYHPPTPATQIETSPEPVQYQPPGPPPSHVTSVLAPPARNPWPAVIVALVALAVAGAIAIVLIMQGGDEGSQPASTPQQPGQAAGQPNQGQPAQPSDAALRSDVEELGQIVDLSEQGRAATAAGDFSSAATNRQEVLDRIDALEVQPELDQSRSLLRGAIASSLRSNVAHQQCGSCARAQAADRSATELKSSFATEFNPFAQKYLGRSYDPSEI